MTGRRPPSCRPAWPKSTPDPVISTAYRTQHTSTWTDPKTGLQVRWVAVEYADFPVVEWTVYFTNYGQADTPVFENLQGIDPATRAVRPERVAAYRKAIRRPRTSISRSIPAGAQCQAAVRPGGGAGSNGAFPYYNLAMPGGGLMLAVGWPGQWAATFARDAGRGLRITAGQELTHLGCGRARKSARR